MFHTIRAGEADNNSLPAYLHDERWLYFHHNQKVVVVYLYVCELLGLKLVRFWLISNDFGILP